MPDLAISQLTLSCPLLLHQLLKQLHAKSKTHSVFSSQHASASAANMEARSIYPKATVGSAAV